MKQLTSWSLLILLSVATISGLGCDDGGGNTDGDADGDSDGDADGDSDGDADGDSDGDADGDSDGDADGDFSRWIELDGSMNTRDLGGYPVNGGKTIRWRTLIRSGHVASLTESGCETFADLGIKTVIDLRMESEVATSPPSDCVTKSASVVSVPMEKILPPSAENYLALMESADEQIAPLFDVLARGESYPLLYHCIIGRDRVNFVNALIMGALGADRETIMEEYRLGSGVEDVWIEAVLDEIDDAGGFETYLSSVGVTPEELTALREHCLE